MYQYSGKLRDDQWCKLEMLLVEIRGKSFSRYENRLFIESILWTVFNGYMWNMLPVRFRKSLAIRKRFYLWNDQNIWHSLIRLLIDDPELQWMFEKIVEYCDLLKIGKINRAQRKAIKEQKNTAPPQNDPH